MGYLSWPRKKGDQPPGCPRPRIAMTGGFAPILKGVRSFDLKQRSDGTTDFAMKEHFAGLMLPLAKVMLAWS